ncbi:MAG: DMT family transporter [Burkholderiaceae bacterium]|nr:MAG: DMT family transporter [Burkholderiaceae bacterium]
MRIPRLPAAGLLLIPPLMWAAGTVVGRVAVGTFPPLAFSFWRWVVALIFVLPFTGRALWQQRTVIVQHWRPLLVLGASGVGGYNSFQYLALTTSPVVNVVLIGAAFPLMMLPVAIIFLRERIGALGLLGMALALAGVLLVLSHGDLQRLLTLEFARGDLIMLAANASWAVYTLVLRKYPLPLPGLQSLTLQIAIGIPVILPFYLWEYAGQGGFSPHASDIAALLFVAVCPSLIAYYFWDKGVQAIGAARAGVFVNLIPVFAALMAILFLDERFNWYHGVALAAMLVGVWLVNRPASALKK